MNLKQKLNPNRFPGMSGKMAAIVGYLIGEKFTDPSFAEIVITSDGFVLARQNGDCGCNDFIGDVSDLKRNWEDLIHIPEVGLIPEEFSYCESLLSMRIRDCGGD